MSGFPKNGTYEQHAAAGSPDDPKRPFQYSFPTYEFGSHAQLLTTYKSSLFNNSKVYSF